MQRTRTSLGQFDRVRALLVASMLGTSALAAPPVIYNLGIFPGGTQSHGAAISHDGMFATGYGDVVTTQTNNYAFRWSIAGGLVNLGVPLGGQNSVGNAINQDGSVIAGTLDNKVFRWTFSGGMQDLGFASLGSSTTGISADGSVIIGNCGTPDSYSRGFRWTSNTSFLLLQGYMNNVGVTTTQAYGVSGDGSQVVGSYPGFQYGPYAMRWSANGSLIGIGAPNGGYYSEATAISRNGAVVFGKSWINDTWRTTSVSTVNLGIVLSRALSANYDGKVVVGSGFTFGAARWSTTAGLQNLNALLPQLGTNLTGWVLNEATGVSNDGSVIVGTGTFNGDTRAFVITGLPCPSVPNIPIPPTARSVCSAPGASATLSMTVEAPGAVTYRWSVESPPDSGVYEPITGPFFADSTGQSFRAIGWDGPELTIQDFTPSAARPSLLILPEVANPCGQIFAPPVQVVLCKTDLDCNEQVDDSDFVLFVSAYDALLCPTDGAGIPASCPADLNSDQQVDDADFVIFAEAYDALLCV